jgi:hypothetical protein
VIALYRHYYLDKLVDTLSGQIRGLDEKTRCSQICEKANKKPAKKQAHHSLKVGSERQ